jgi:hypothetical protein
MAHSTFDDNVFEKFRKRLEEEMARKDSTPQSAVQFKSSRAELFNELYSLYEQSYKKNVWDDYRKWLARNRFRHNQQRALEFKKTKDFRKPITVRSFCSFWFGFLKTDDLYYLLSVARDKTRRGENLNKWLFWAIKSNSVV